MADFAVHLTQATQTCGRPSIFDLMAQESLMSSLRPAFEFSMRILAEQFPDKLSKLLSFSDEIFYGIITLIERHFIWTKNASFSEYFYGLKRISLSLLSASKQSACQLSLSQKISSLLLLTFLPYLVSKLEKKYLRIKEETLYDETWEGTFIGKFCFRIYPLLHFFLEWSKLGAMVFYVIKLVNFNSVSNGIIGVTLAYSNFDEDMNKDKIEISSENSNGGVMFALSKLVRACSMTASLSIEYALPTVVFFLRFVEWWYSTTNSPHNEVNSLPIPAPPVDSKIASNGISLPAHPSQCPLCDNIHKNPTALSISGYVFCYSCIFKFIDTNGYCPVTHLHCNLDDLARLYF